MSLRCLAVVCLLWLSACNSGEKRPDVSGIKVDLKSYRFDKDLEALDTNHIAEGLQQLNKRYPDFLNFYLDTLMGFNIQGNYIDSSQGIQQGLRSFLTYKDYTGLFDTVNKHFPDTKSTDGQLRDGFRFMKYYYPDYREPKVIYLTSGLNNWGAFTYGPDILGVGLDMFLTGSYPYYKSVGIAGYLYTHLRPEFIPVAAFSAIYEDGHPLQVDERYLLDLLIQKGKEEYFLHKILPNTPDSVMLGYTQAQVAWCEHNEAEVYNFFIQANLLYNKDRQQIMRYVTDGPFSTGMPKESPGNIGTWLGWQIVKAYMQQHSNVTLQQLLSQNSDAQQFLEESKYKPK